MFRVLVSNRSFNRLEYLDSVVDNLSWDYSAIGGCGSCRFSIPMRRTFPRNIAPDFNVKVYKRNDSTDSFDLWYQGYIRNNIRRVDVKKETRDILCVGYAEQLNHIHVSKTYSTSTEISVIVKDVLDTFIVPETAITYSASDIVASSFSASQLKFNHKGKSVIQTLADLVDYEWGVTADRKFYFKPRSTTVGLRYVEGRQLTNFFSDDYSGGIVNRIIIKGGDVSGSPFRPAAFDHANSQLKWGRRDEEVDNSAIVTQDVAQQYADATFAKKALVVRRGTADLEEVVDSIESTTPIPLFERVTKRIAYGQRKYGTILYQGRLSFSISRIQYRVDKNNILSTSLDLGEPKPGVAEAIAQIQYNLDQSRTQDL